MDALPIPPSGAGYNLRLRLAQAMAHMQDLKFERVKKLASPLCRSNLSRFASLSVLTLLAVAVPCSQSQTALNFAAADANLNPVSRQARQMLIAAADGEDKQTKPADSNEHSGDARESTGSKEKSPAKRHKKAENQTENKEELTKPEQAIGSNDKKPYSPEAVKHYNRGVELHQSGFLNQAITEYKAAIEADPRMEEAYSNLGVIYAAQRNYPRAKESFTTALNLKPNRPTTLNGLGTVLYAQGHIKEAKQKWEQALAVDPNFASAYYNVGNAYESEKDMAGAVNSYARAIAAIPSMADAYYRIGSIYYKQRHYPQASVLLRKAIELSPDSDFVREAKRMEGNLETDFAKSESESRRNRNYAMNRTNEASATKKRGKSSEPLDMFVQPGNHADKAANNRSEDSPVK
jgi:tetratricopeptide (TPR) repeat protein